MTPKDFLTDFQVRIQALMEAHGGTCTYRSSSQMVELWTIPTMRGVWNITYAPMYFSQHKRDRGPYVALKPIYERTKTASRHRGVHSQGYCRSPIIYLFQHNKLQADDPSVFEWRDKVLKALETVLVTRCGDALGLKKQGKAPTCKQCPVELMCLMGEIKG